MFKSEYQHFIENIFKKFEDQDSLVIDGPIDMHKWDNAKLKLLFYYKETYGYNEYGGTSISDNYKQWIYDNIKTYKKIGLLSYLLIESYSNSKIIDFDEIELKRLYNDHDFLIEVVSKVSLVNIGKISIPANKTSDSLIRDKSRINSIFLKKQLEILNPHVIICGGRVTADSLYSDLNYLSKSDYVYDAPEIIDNKVIAPICHLSSGSCWYESIYGYYLQIIGLLLNGRHLSKVQSEK